MVNGNATIRIGSLIKTPIGVYGVVYKFNKEDKLYSIAWAGGLRRGDTVIYDKKMIHHLLEEEEGWKLFSPGGKHVEPSR